MASQLSITVDGLLSLAVRAAPTDVTSLPFSNFFFLKVFVHISFFSHSFTGFLQRWLRASLSEASKYRLELNIILCSCTLDRLQKSQCLGQNTHHLFYGVVLWSYRVALGRPRQIGVGKRELGFENKSSGDML